MKILIIDDDATDQKLIKRAVKNLDVEGEFETAETGDEGLNKVGLFQPDVVFLDVNLPQESGFEIHKKIKAINAELPIILLTGATDAQHYQKANEAGVKAYINKNSIEQSLRTILNRFKLLSRPQKL